MVKEKSRATKTESKELLRIKELIREFETGSYNSLGIICNTQNRAEKLYRLLNYEFKISLLNAISVTFGIGFGTSSIK